MGRTYRINAISHKKKNPPANLDQIYTALGEYNGATLEKSWVLYTPNYKDAGAMPAPPDPTLAAQAGMKLFEIPNIATPADIPEILFLEAIPENSYFITADNKGQIIVIDSNEPVTPSYPASSIYFSGELGKTIVGLKYRDLLSKYVIGTSDGYAQMYIFNLVNIPPISLNHGATINSIEVFKFDDRVMTGGSNGEMKLWNSATQALIKSYNVAGAEGNQVNDISWVISSNFFISVHQDGSLNIWKIDGVESHVVKLATAGVPYYVASIENTRQFLVAFRGTFGVRRYESDNLGCHNFCKTCTGASDYECSTCFNDFTLTTSFYCKRDCDYANKQYYDLATNGCLACSTGCQKCTRERAIDCTECETGYWKHPDNSCHIGC